MGLESVDVPEVKAADINYNKDLLTCEVGNQESHRPPFLLYLILGSIASHTRARIQLPFPG